METIIKISENLAVLANELATELAGMFNKAAFRKKHITVALSGGTTPAVVYSALGNMFSEKTDWSYVHFFWGDERCVPPDDSESNFNMTRRTLFDKIRIPGSNIHRIMGEEIPEQEALRYSDEIAKVANTVNNLPAFDLILLGLGNDGHTASIFSSNRKILFSENICEVAVHPSSGQKRITLTGRVINNAFNVIFLVTGVGKAEIVADIIEKPGVVNYPAAAIEPSHGTLKWYLDNDAASLLSQWA